MSSTETALHQALARQLWLNRAHALWVTLLSLAQAVTLALLFTRSRPMEDSLPFHAPCRCEPNKPANTTQQFIVNFQNGSCQPMGELDWMSEDGSKPVIVKDGRYFLYIQITLQSEAENLTYTVHVENSHKQKTLISLTLTKKSNELTSRYQGRQVLLEEGDKLSVTCAPPVLINTTAFATFLGTHFIEAF